MLIVKTYHKIYVITIILLLLVQIILIFTPVSRGFLPDKETSVKIYILSFIICDSILLLFIVVKIFNATSTHKIQKEKERIFIQFQFEEPEFININDKGYIAKNSNLLEKIRNGILSYIHLEQLLIDYKHRMDEESYSSNSIRLNLIKKFKLEVILFNYAKLNQKCKNKSDKELCKRVLKKIYKLEKEILNLNNSFQEFERRIKIQFPN